MLDSSARPTGVFVWAGKSGAKPTPGIYVLRDSFRANHLEAGLRTALETLRTTVENSPDRLWTSTFSEPRFGTRRRERRFW